MPHNLKYSCEYEIRCTFIYQYISLSNIFLIGKVFENYEIIY